MKKNIIKSLLAMALLVSGMIACQKEFSGPVNNQGPATPVDLGTRVTTSVSGFVTDENDAPAVNATVKFGTQQVVTDEYGFFELQNISVPKNAAMVSVSKDGYFPGIRTFIAKENKSTFVKIKLLPKTNNGTISAVNGGNVTLPNGLKVELPANAVVNAASGAVYSGTIHVAAQWINPTASDLDRIMPGDLRAVDADNNMKLLVTYGMAAVELTGGSGEKLQIATGKKATLTWPLPASLSGSAPASIPLWYFDESIGLWKEEGTATKSGSNYIGEVSHFSFWNCDVPNNYVQLDMTIKDQAGNPVRYAQVKVTNTSDNSWAYGFTDTAGYVNGAVPSNANLTVEVAYYYSCNSALYTQSVTTTSSNLSLGTITINTAAYTAYLGGTVTDCSNAPVNDGAILLKMGNSYIRYAVSNGSFNIPLYLCGASSQAITIIAEDYVGGQQSSVISHTAVVGSNALGNIQACGISSAQFLNIDINGTASSFTAPSDSLTYFYNGQNGSSVSAASSTGTGTVNQVNFFFTHSGITAGSTYPISDFSTSLISGNITLNTSASSVQITEYGAIGEFISGTYTITATGPAPASTPYTITGSFRVRRYN
ncbi:MAG: hypothetical protein QM687_14095 [Ferruginibacter sp.]